MQINIIGMVNRHKKKLNTIFDFHDKHLTHLAIIPRQALQTLSHHFCYILKLHRNIAIEGIYCIHGTRKVGVYLNSICNRYTTKPTFLFFYMMELLNLYYMGLLWKGSWYRRSKRLDYLWLPYAFRKDIPRFVLHYGIT